MTNQNPLVWLKNELRKNPKQFRRTVLYRLLRDELTALGYWRKRARGNPRKGYQAMQDNKSKI